MTDNVLIKDINQNEFSAAEANRIATIVNASLEQSKVMQLIRNAASKGKFYTFAVGMSLDTIKWLEQKLGFKVEPYGEIQMISWFDE